MSYYHEMASPAGDLEVVTNPAFSLTKYDASAMMIQQHIQQIFRISKFLAFLSHFPIVDLDYDCKTKLVGHLTLAQQLTES